MGNSRQTTPNPRFELSGGALCLDLSNTWGFRERPDTDRLTDYEALLQFALEAGLLDGVGAADLRRKADEDPGAAAEVFRAALRLREALHRLFAARAKGEAIEARDLEELNTVLGPALGHQRLDPQDDCCGWGWDAKELEFPLWPVARSAANLLTSDELDRVRECDADDCDWLFLDRSRNRSRRWCSMESCGNRAKVRRHYRRRKAD